MTSMTHTDRRPRRVVLSALLTVAVVLAASCSSDEQTADATSAPGTATTEGDGPDGTKRESLPPTDDAGSEDDAPDEGASEGDAPDDGASDDGASDDGASDDKAPDDAGNDVEAPDDSPDPSCEPGEGRTITEIEDVVTDEVVVDPVVVEDQEVDGETVPGFEIPGFTIAGQRVDGGCIVEYDAPAGCLGRIEVTSVTIPGTTIPGVEVPGVEAPGVEDAEGGSEAEVTLDAVTVEGAEEPQVCQPEPPEGGGYVPTVYRDVVYRDVAYRDVACTADSDCLSSVTVPSVTVPSVTVPSVTVASVTVPSRTLEGRDVGGLEGVPVYGDDQETAYLAPADVLFDFDSDELRPSADPVLGRIADEASKAGPGARISVDGHTDARGDDDYNQGLSERRAQAVADWLIERGDLDGEAIVVTGFGESAPVAPNETPSGEDDPDGRQQNRRVVIGVEV